MEGAAQVEQILNDLIVGYESDFVKYSGRRDADAIRRVFREAARQLHTEQDGTTGKFIFNELPFHLSRYQRMRGPLDWLESSQLLIRVPICPNPAMPLAHQGTELYSWVGATSEVEFLVQMGDAVVPVEVKSSSRSRRARSLQAYIKKYAPSRAVKVTGQNYGRTGPLVTLPLYALQHLARV